MNIAMETYYYNAVSAAGFLTSQMIWWSDIIDWTEVMVDGA
tara:strand:- start:1396 stop:1518 length:123 start_codon:yes stop_codon:yes gene_type:complete